MLTVVIASYQYGYLAAHCIESILSQTKLPERILFVDDGAGDCFHLQDRYPEIEYIFRHKRLGTVANFQDMLMRVQSEYTLFMDADNWLRSDAVEKLQEASNNQTIDIVTYDVILTGEKKNQTISRDGSSITPYNGDRLWKRDWRHHGAIMYRTKLGQDVGYEALPRCKNSCEDFVIWSRMRAKGARVSYLPEPLLYYRKHRSNHNPN